MCHPRFVAFVYARYFYWKEVFAGIDKGLMQIGEFFRTGPKGAQLVPGKLYQPPAKFPHAAVPCVPENLCLFRLFCTWQFRINKNTIMVT